MKIRLSTKMTVTLMGLILTAVVGAGIALAYAWQEKHTMDKMVSTNVGEVMSVAELDIELLKQRGFVEAYMLDKGNKQFLQELGRREPAFGESLDRAEKYFGTERDRAMIRKIREAFARYVAKREEVVSLYDRGNVEGAIDLYLGGLDAAYYEAIAACDDILEANKQDIVVALADERREIERLTVVMAGSGALVAVLGIGLSWLLFSQVFVPLRRLANDMRTLSEGAEPAPVDELDALQYRMRTLLEEISRSRAGQGRKEQGDAQLDRLAAVGNAVAFIAHEIRNRLTTIGGYAHMIEGRPTDSDRVQRQAGIILQSASRLEQMLGEVMEYSRPRERPRTPHSLNDLVGETAAQLAASARAGVAIELALDPATPEVVMDPGAVEQVIINLVRNATEAMTGGGAVKVSTKPSPGGATLIVADNGPGIPEEVRNRIFEPFFTTKRTGSGLGLSICRKIVQEHGGEMSLTSEPGAGTTFVVTFRNPGSEGRRP
jgi:signal transduction histidine kinase